MGEVTASSFTGKKLRKFYDKDPNKCPFCHNRITPRKYEGFSGKNGLEIVFRCSNDECQKVFIGIYEEDFNDYYLIATTIGNHQPRAFTENIATLSPNFVEIYNQALTSEYYNLEHISGIGYRKALEFLIKDYLISKFPVKEDEIKNKFLGKCINEEIDNSNLKEIAKRAAWLGNDETHYVRKWETKDVKDLKNLIEISIHWIDMELLTEQYKTEMK